MGPAEAKPCIVVVHEDVLARKALARRLSDQGVVFLAANPREAQLLFQDLGHVDVLVVAISTDRCYDAFDVMRLLAPRHRAALRILFAEGIDDDRCRYLAGLRLAHDVVSTADAVAERLRRGFAAADHEAHNR
jgi:CheY-like chemotaxis protein